MSKQVPDKTITDECKYCAEGEPEWSPYAKCWIHRRATLDKRCTRKRLGPVGEPAAEPRPRSTAWLQGAFITEHGWWGGGESNAAPAPAAPLLPALDVAKKLANVGGIDRWEKILQEWLDSYIARWKTEEQIWREPVPAAPLDLQEKAKQWLRDHWNERWTHTTPSREDNHTRDMANFAADAVKAELARLTTHIAAQNEVLSALCAKAGVDFTDVEAAKKALDGRTAELEQVKAERDRLKKTVELMDLAVSVVPVDQPDCPSCNRVQELAEAALGEKGKQ